MINQPDIYALTPREQYMPQPGSDFIVDVAGETPMRQMAMRSVARERDVMFRNRMQGAGPPTPNPAPQGNIAPGGPATAAAMLGAAIPGGAQNLSSAVAGGMPGGDSNPSPGMPAPVEQSPSSATAGMPAAGPRLLSPPEWAAKFMPNLANQPYVSKRQLTLMHQGYAAYVHQTQNDQQMAHQAAEESRYNRQFDISNKRENRMEEHYKASEARQSASDAETARYHTEEIGIRKGELNRKQGLSPQDQAYADATATYLADHPGDHMGALAAASLAAKGGARGSNAREPSLLDKSEFNKRMNAGPLGVGPGMANDTEAWNKDPIAQFKKYASYVRGTMSTANPGERKLLQQALIEKAPYKTAAEVRAAYAAGKFDPPNTHGGFWDAVNPSRSAAGESAEEHQARMQQAGKAMEEYAALLGIGGG